MKGFVREVFYAYDRYSKMCKTVLDGLYARHSATVVRTDYNLYLVMTILAVKKLPEIGMPTFRKFVLTQTHHKMHTLLNFLWSPEHMDGWLADQWALIYDLTYVKVCTPTLMCTRALLKHACISATF